MLVEGRGQGLIGMNRGRSRNDQVATDLRLYLRDQLREIEALLITLLNVITERADKEIDYLMPGYTHLQRGQVIHVFEKAIGTSLANYF